MREAFARGGLWFFGTIIAICIFLPQYLKDHDLGEQLVRLLFAGIIIGGAIFFYTWYNHELEERELRNEERLKALGKSDDDAQR